MIVLTQKNIENWEVPVSKFSKLMADFVQEKQGWAGPATFFSLPVGLVSVFALVGGVFEESWLMAIAGVVGIALTLGSIHLACALAKPYLKALGNSIEAYLASQPIDRVIDQAVSLGPSYLGRQYLLNHLDDRDNNWSEKHLERLVRLARAEELPANQVTRLRWYLQDKHPGWSGAGTPPEREIKV